MPNVQPPGPVPAIEVHVATYEYAAGGDARDRITLHPIKRDGHAAADELCRYSRYIPLRDGHAAADELCHYSRYIPSRDGHAAADELRRVDDVAKRRCAVGAPSEQSPLQPLHHRERQVSHRASGRPAVPQEAAAGGGRRREGAKWQAGGREVAGRRARDGRRRAAADSGLSSACSPPPSRARRAASAPFRRISARLSGEYHACDSWEKQSERARPCGEYHGCEWGVTDVTAASGM